MNVVRFRKHLVRATLTGLGTLVVVADVVAQSATTTVVDTVLKSHYLRLPFDRPVRRLAIGDAGLASAELVTDREVLVLGRDTGRTTLIVWFADGSLRQSVVSIQRDLSVLRDALHRIHTSLDVQSAPDREAIILTGIVPTIDLSQAAEAAARSYLDAGATRGGGRPLVVAPSTPDAASPGATPAAGTAAITGAVVGGPAAAPTIAPEAVRVQGELRPNGSVINLIRLEQLPPLPEERIRAAVASLGGRDVTVRRVQRGVVRDDSRDTLVLEGRVPSQVALVRVVSVAAQVFAGHSVTEEEIRVVADEGGALIGSSQGAGAQGQGGQNGLQSSSSGIPGLGGSRGAALNNQVRRNIGRATVVEAAAGRILSFLTVTDLPQVRVDIRLLEVNRSRLLSFSPRTNLLGANGKTRADGTPPPTSTAVQDVLSFLSGTAVNALQVSSPYAAVDVALSLLERAGIARSLSSPSLTVLSGESAQFQVGGEVPVPVAFAPGFGGTTAAPAGIFSAVDFVPFGLRLEVRPSVGDDGTVTVDVQPQIVTPDATLTDTIRQSTGTNQSTTAFQTRALRTSSRLQDGQVLLLGGLTSQTSSASDAATPGLGQLPGLGWLFKSVARDDSGLDLVVVVNPVILRTPIPDLALWSFPSGSERLDALRERLHPAGGPR